jgi:hypothetical protein
LVSEKQLRSVLLGSGAAVALLASPAVAGQVDDLKSQIEALQNRLDQVEVQQTRIEERQESVAPANAVVGGEFPGSWKMPGSDTSISFSGYVKTDFIYDLGPDAGDTFFASGIPVDDSAAQAADGNVRLHARQSRFRFDSRTPTDWGQLRTRIEGDFFGAGGTETFSNSNSFRLRHAWGQLGPVMAGQNWTTMMDQDTWANTLDFAGPASVIFARQAQIRYSTGLMEGLSLDLAVENPEMQVIQLNAAGTGRNATGVVDIVPDMVGALRYRDSWGAVNVSSVVRHFNWDTGTAGEAADTWGYGVHIGATINVPFITEGDVIRAVFNFGDGIGRYMTYGTPGVVISCSDPGHSGASPLSVPGCTAQMDTQDAYGWWVGGTHHWTDAIQSNLFYGSTSKGVAVDRLGAIATQGLTSDTQSLHANLLWNPVSAVTIGLEYIHGWNNLVSNTVGNEGSGTASRFQLGMQYSF